MAFPITKSGSDMGRSRGGAHVLPMRVVEAVFFTRKSSREAYLPRQSLADEGREHKRNGRSSVGTSVRKSSPHRCCALFSSG